MLGKKKPTRQKAVWLKGYKGGVWRCRLPSVDIFDLEEAVISDGKQVANNV